MSDVVMKVYRLEHKRYGLGPFTSGVGIPEKWYDSHESPMRALGELGNTFTKWRRSIDDGTSFIPEKYKFSFSSLSKLESCFNGYQKFEEFILKELVIDIRDPLSYCILPDGQVIFSVVLSSNIINKDTYYG